MGLETVSNITDLVSTNPVSNDPKSEGDDHIRNIKVALKTDFANITAPVTATHVELNYNDIATLGTAEASKTVTCDASKAIIGLTSVSSTAFIGALTGTVTGAVTGSLTGNVVGDVTGNISGTSTAWATPRSITITGDVTAPAQNLDGNSNVTFTTDIATATVNFSNEMTAVFANYDHNFADISTVVVPAGMYNYGTFFLTSGSMDGTMFLEVNVDSSWRTVWSAAVVSGVATIPIGQITSNGTHTRTRFAYSSGTKGTHTFRMSKIYS